MELTELNVVELQARQAEEERAAAAEEERRTAVLERLKKFTEVSDDEV